MPFRFQFQGRQAQRQRLQVHFQQAVFPRGDIPLCVQGDRQLEPAVIPGAQAHRRICVKGELPMPRRCPEACQVQGQGVGREPPPDAEGIQLQARLDPFRFPGLHLPVQAQALHGKLAEQGVRQVGIYDERAVCQEHPVQPDGRQGLAFAVGFSQGKDIPGGRRGVVTVGEDTGMAELRLVDVIGAADQVRVVDAQDEFIQGNQRVGLRAPPPANPFPAGVTLMGIGYGKLVRLYVKIREAFDYMGLNLPEGDISLYEIRRNPVDDTGEDAGPKQDLQRHQQHQYQPRQPQHDIPYDFPRLHGSSYKDSTSRGILPAGTKGK